ncbi:hypothetical protein HAX54_006598 [Datura stramonium]|uniref:Uncharacterized protein n=1 Tax=Datura stramonium TaxID=4076 RepID=A0ABS8WY75_DATST|nr:hypothetical protein [Datura stramonium]
MAVLLVSSEREEERKYRGLLPELMEGLAARIKPGRGDWWFLGEVSVGVDGVSGFGWEKKEKREEGDLVGVLCGCPMGVSGGLRRQPEGTTILRRSDGYRRRQR